MATEEQNEHYLKVLEYELGQVINKLYEEHLHTDEVTEVIINAHKEVSNRRGLDVPVASYRYVAKKMLSKEDN